MTAQTLEPVAIVGDDADFGVQGETLDVAAQFAWNESGAYVISATA